MEILNGVTFGNIVLSIINIIFVLILEGVNASRFDNNSFYSIKDYKYFILLFQINFVAMVTYPSSQIFSIHRNLYIFIVILFFTYTLLASKKGYLLLSALFIASIFITNFYLQNSICLIASFILLKKELELEHVFFDIKLIDLLDEHVYVFNEHGQLLYSNTHQFNNIKEILNLNFSNNAKLNREKKIGDQVFDIQFYSYVKKKKVNGYILMLYDITKTYNLIINNQKKEATLLEIQQQIERNINIDKQILREDVKRNIMTSIEKDSIVFLDNILETGITRESIPVVTSTFRQELNKIRKYVRELV